MSIKERIIAIWEWNCGLVAIVTYVCLFLFLLGVVCYYGDKSQCNSYQRETGRESKYRAGTCYVKHTDGEWYILKEPA